MHGRNKLMNNFMKLAKPINLHVFFVVEWAI